jgi:hypothetical protein
LRESSYAQGLFKFSVEGEIDWDSDKLVSFSQYSKYQKCPHAWELEYPLQHKVSSESIYLVYGTAMHNVIQSWLEVCYTKTAKLANDMDLNSMLLNEMKEEYLKRTTACGYHFSTKEELGTFFSDGCQILNYLKKKRSLYFSRKNMKLMGIELPLLMPIDKTRPNVKLTAHLDLVFYDTKMKKYIIIDIKTSKNGWNKYKKKDKNTTDQLLLYKKYFCERFDIDPKSVQIVYFILRQKIDPDSLWPIKRISEFSPSDGSVSLNRVKKSFQNFIDECFDENGQYRDRKHPAIAGPNYYNCRFCPYNDKLDLCPKENRITDV